MEAVLVLQLARSAREALNNSKPHNITRRNTGEAHAYDEFTRPRNATNCACATQWQGGGADQAG